MAEGVAWLFTFGSGAVLGFLVAAITGFKMRRVSRWLDRLLDEDELTYRSPQRSIPLPQDWECHPN